jgi:hypothetical protein
MQITAVMKVFLKHTDHLQLHVFGTHMEPRGEFTGSGYP